MKHICRIMAAIWLASSLLGQLGPAHAAQSILTPVVKDATGKIVGPLNEGGAVLVQLHPGEQPVRLTVSFEYGAAAGIPLLGASPVHNVGWLTTGCTGTAYVIVDVERTAFNIFENGMYLYFSEPNATPAPLQTGSFRAQGRQCAPGRLTFNDAVPAMSIKAKSLDYKPPFSLGLVPKSDSRRPFVVDNGGKIVGQYYTINYSCGTSPCSVSRNYVIMPLPSAAFGLALLRLTSGGTFGIDSEGYQGTDSFYESSDCTGPRYIRYPYSTAFYGFIDPARPQYLTYLGPNRKVAISSTFANNRCSLRNETDVFQPVQLLKLEALGFTTPFAVKLR